MTGTTNFDGNLTLNNVNLFVEDSNDNVVFQVDNSGNATIEGTLQVTNSITSNGTELSIVDTLVKIGANADADDNNRDIGFYAPLSGNNENLGLIWDENESCFRLYESLNAPSGERFNFTTGVASKLEIGRLTINGSAEDGGSGVATPLTNHATYYSTDAAETSTLAAGSEGQVKVLAMASDGGDMVVTVTNPAWGGSGTLTLSEAGAACTLQYIGGKWYVIGSSPTGVATA